MDNVLTATGAGGRRMLPGRAVRRWRQYRSRFSRPRSDLVRSLAPPRVVLLTTVNLQEGSAAPAHLAAVCRVLSSDGFEVTLLAGSAPPASIRDATASVRPPRWRRLQRHLPTSATVLFLLGPLCRELLGRRADVVYVRCSSATFLATLLARLLGARLVVSEHNGWLRDELKVLGHSQIASRLAGWAQVTEARSAHLVRAVVPEIAAKLRSEGVAPERLIVAGNGTNIDKVRPRDRALCLAALGRSERRCHLGFLGKLSAWQGVDDAIRALRILASQDDGVDLIIAGDGPERQNLERLTSELDLDERVIFLGEIAQERVPEVLGAFDIALAPKTTVVAENGMSPLKVRDYAAAGRPVVAPSLPGFDELALHGWLLTYAPHDAKDLAAVLLKLISDPERRSTMGARARNYAEDYFDWSVVLEPLRERLRPTGSELCDQPRNRSQRRSR